MANVLVVTALELGHPMAVFVLMKAHDFPVHGSKPLTCNVQRAAPREAALGTSGRGELTGSTAVRSSNPPGAQPATTERQDAWTAWLSGI